ncbi:MAG TPA: aminotransferase class V-fold PLP-dependent enzyme [Pseudonocardiaceae bacterium]|nr:aminotransferase class V-fold PLP-dependent enzyme [Pseudonocardiaceae bacterium]
MISYKRHFTRFLAPDPERLHVAAHSHHPWPDVTFEAQQRAWLDAAALHDDKWDLLLGTVLPEAGRHVAGQLGLPDPATVTFAPSTHDLVLRLLSCLPVPTRILTTDSEFHSFARQVRRLEEAGLAVVDRVAAEPFDTFTQRLRHSTARGGHDLVFFSQVHFNSGFAVSDLAAVIAAVPADETFVVVDGYHGFMALPTDLAAIANRAFYLAGGYKYAMAGEGACFLHCPPGYGERPVNTGWFAGFAELIGPSGQVSYQQDAARFLGATFDATGLYRFNAAQRLLDELGLSVPVIHARVRRLQARFLDRLDALQIPGLGHRTLVPPPEIPGRGNFLTFRLPDAGAIRQRLRARKVTTDHRDDRLRFGFGIYHDEDDVDALCHRLSAIFQP